ncbi:Uncharacterized protein BP5553_00029 [Venustampulla echinocandica]|uniref:Cytochrome P450 n=1 Tax=Venustampulla echinocandica TaxID=2656787 RepID=A0A370TX03_9HELO|nr:Uncharacterized protein BP5553_00029 [Venustampulla echinocandica]RDL40050.1 Uncharacterized protein BP5553_00029 [Venustampulla echinocandica]
MDSIPWTTVSYLLVPELVKVLAILYSAYYVLSAVYIVTLSPLAGIPGPKRRKFSYLPCAFASLKGRESYAVRDLHDKYGPVVRVSPEMVSFIGPTAWKDIYGYPAVKKFKKSGYLQLRPGVPDVLTANGVDHARQRAALNRAFSEKALREQEHHLQGHIDLFMERMEQRCDQVEPINIVQWFEFLAFDIIGTLAFSSSFHCLENQRYHPWVTLLMNFFKSVHYFLTAKKFGILFPILIIFGPIRDLIKGREHFRRSFQKVQERLKMPDNDRRHDFWTYISRQNQEKQGSMSIREMEVNAAILIPAGSDTIATTLAGCCYLLLKNPNTLARLRIELTEKFTSESEITMVNLSGLPYIKAVVNEGLRMYPPLSGDLRREVPPEGATISGQFIPGGVIVSVYALAAYDSVSNFAQPYRFTPERWLTTDERPDWTKNDHLEVCQPFSVGPRNCIGMNLAYLETKLILARLFFRLNLELMDDAFEIGKQRVFIMREKPPLRVRLSHRM